MKSLKNTSKHHLLSLYASVIIPLGASPQWHNFEFSKSPANSVTHNAKALTIDVNQSASPLLYTLKSPLKLQSLQVTAEYRGKLGLIPKNKTQGNRSYDDFVLRFGLIVKGDQRLNWLQRQLAPTWLVAMERLLPQQYGIDEVYFVTTCRQKKLLGRQKSHFFNSALKEECVHWLEKQGPFQLQKDFTESPEILGFWIATDGDDLQSQYQLTIKEIKLNRSEKSL